MSTTNSRTKPVPVIERPAQFSFLRIPVVLKRRGISRSAHYAEIQAGLYPSTVAIGRRAVAHPDYEVDAMNVATLEGCSDDEKRALVQKLEAVRDSAA